MERGSERVGERKMKPQTRLYSAIKALEDHHNNPQRKGLLANDFNGFVDSQSNWTLTLLGTNKNSATVLFFSCN